MKKTNRASNRLKSQIERGKLFLNEWNVLKYKGWKSATETVIAEIYGKNSPQLSSIFPLKVRSVPYNDSDYYLSQQYYNELKESLAVLESLAELLEASLDGEEFEPEKENKKQIGNDIFLVHGRDEKMLHSVARFLEKLGLKTIILREQPSQGRTVIEKINDYSNVGFAVVLLSPDDRGGLAGLSFNEQSLRARQNVIFELGYFIGRLGRNRVSAIYKKEIEIPSDYSGVAFVPYSADGGWRTELAKELKAASINFDANKMLGL